MKLDSPTVILLVPSLQLSLNVPQDVICTPGMLELLLSEHVGDLTAVTYLVFV